MLTNKLCATNKLRAAFMLPLAVLIAAFLTLAISPTARAAVQSLFSFNGVEVTIDPETGKLRAEGNSDAILYQDDQSVFIMGEDGKSGVGISQAESTVALEVVPVAEVAQTVPDFVLPTNIPAGYEMATEAAVADGVVVIDWHNEAGDTITYQWGTPPVPDNAGDQKMLEALNAEVVEVAPPGYQQATGMDGTELGLYNGESNGVPVQIITTDTSLTAEILQAMIP
ncbi:MAG: hypothetical protein KC423_25030 [Anaerolineales bacterium]|nr:hypothetical protein [Anaerolineales bacterium]